MKTDYGYSRAQMWTGDALKSYIRRERRRLEREAEKVLDRNRNAVEQFKAVAIERREFKINDDVIFVAKNRFGVSRAVGVNNVFA